MNGALLLQVDDVVLVMVVIAVGGIRMTAMAAVHISAIAPTWDRADVIDVDGVVVEGPALAA